MWQPIGLTFVVLAVVGLGFVTARQVERAQPEPPAVSASPDSRLWGQLTAQVAVKGRRFDVYVGKIPGRGGETHRHWSVAVPTAD